MTSSFKAPTIIDNLGANTLQETLAHLLRDCQTWDIATGTFEVGSLLALDGAWQPVDRIRVLMGDETTARTRAELVAALNRQTEDSIEAQKERDDDQALAGLAAVRHALDQQQIAVRVYSRAKFHAKTHILDTRAAPIDYAIVGSSNFTEPGLNRNLELNLFTTDGLHIGALREWFARVWGEGEDVQADLIRVIQRHLREYTPFEVWAKALYEYFLGRQAPESDWETRQSVMFPLLSRYQQDGYLAARRIARQRGGAFICDGVGLGKTFIGLMLLEYHLHRGERILLIVPKSARESVWQRNLERYLYHDYRIACKEHLKVHNQTDFGRDGTVPDDILAYYRDYFDVILVDEAHHFRTPSANRSRSLMTLVGGRPKTSYFLTATPINNRLLDLYHLINYLAQNRQDYFRDLGIQNLRSYFIRAEKKLEEELLAGGAPDVQTGAQEADILRTDQLLRELVIQRSRAYVQDSERAAAQAAGVASRLAFPDRKKPRVIRYSLKRVYADLYDEISAAFGKAEPLISLAAYNPERFRRGAPDSELVNRGQQVLGLVRTLLLKRLESSYIAFQGSLEDLLRKMAYFLEQHDKERWEGWKAANAAAWRTVQEHWHLRHEKEAADTEAEEDDDFEADAFPLDCVDPHLYDVPHLLTHVEADMALLLELLQGLFTHLSPAGDDKLLNLVAALNTDPLLRGEKVVIFTEFRDTARYLWRELRSRGFAQVEEIDSTRKVNRETVIRRFAPFYNCTADERPSALADPIRVLISTDVLSEGLNLQDASRIINYDLHWNPVRLMQRIGRVDRRLDPSVERALGRDSDTVKVYVFNFLPPDDLERLLALFRTLSGKLLRISKTLGIEAPVLTPDDDFAALRHFNETYLGHKSVEERLHEELQAIRRDHADLYERLKDLPRRVRTGRQGETKGLFCAYRFPAMSEDTPGELRWYFRAAATGEIWEANRLGEIADAIRATAETPRVETSAAGLKAWREEIEQRCVRPFLRSLQTLAGQRATLVCWMEVQ